MHNILHLVKDRKIDMSDHNQVQGYLFDEGGFFEFFQPGQVLSMYNGHETFTVVYVSNGKVNLSTNVQCCRKIFSWR